MSENVSSKAPDCNRPRNPTRRHCNRSRGNLGKSRKEKSKAKNGPGSLDKKKIKDFLFARSRPIFCFAFSFSRFSEIPRARSAVASTGISRAVAVRGLAWHIFGHFLAENLGEKSSTFGTTKEKEKGRQIFAIAKKLKWILCRSFKEFALLFLFSSFFLFIFYFFLIFMYFFGQKCLLRTFGDFFKKGRKALICPFLKGEKFDLNRTRLGDNWGS